jgi:hypothetical protein
MPYSLRWNNPRYWQRRAEEARTIAEAMSHIEARAGMLRLAADYEVMARRAEEWSEAHRTVTGPADPVGATRRLSAME